MDRYERLKVLGVGSFGKVYLMRHRQERRLVCAKIIKIKNIPRKEREACRTEVDLLRRLHHPNIVGYKDSFLTPRKDHLCIVMEYCDGGDLSTQIKIARRRLFPESKILHWFVQIALGLHYMHGRLVLHRDLKTQNIFLLGNGRLVLGDLGISKVLEGTMDFANTRIGTPYYMSPELFNNKPYNHKSDIWALGCVLYEMAALSHAFDATSLHGLAHRVAKGRYPSIHVKYSQNLRDLISRMLSTSPAERPDLDQILQLGFIRKHIHNFLADIVSRESHKIGEGTMVLKAAAVSMLADAEGSSNVPGVSGGGVIAGLGSNPEMLSLKRQMEELGLQDEVKRALHPPEIMRPNNAHAAAKVVKEQTGALRREEERRKAVEAALARLRKERQERLRLRHGRENRNPPLPPPPSAPASDAGPKYSRVGGGWQAGIVGVGVGIGSEGPSGEGGGGRGREGAGAAAARQLEAAAARRMGGLLRAGGKESRPAAAVPYVSGQPPAAPRSRESRRSLEPRERRADPGSKVSSRAQGRRSSFGGEARKASPVFGVAAAADGGGGGRVRSSAVDQSDVSRVKDLDKFSRAREAERLAAEARARREEASSREAARRRDEALQRERERERLRQDKVELDRKMLERQKQRRQRAAAAAAKVAAVKEQQVQIAAAKEKEERKEQQRLQILDNFARASAASGATTISTSPPVGAAPEPTAVAGSSAANPPPISRSRARWAQAVTPPETASARDIIQLRKEEKLMLEEVVKMKERGALQAQHDGRRRARSSTPPPRPPTVDDLAVATSPARDAGERDRNSKAPSLAPANVSVNTLSPCGSRSEDSEDSDNLSWGVGAGARAAKGKRNSEADGWRRYGDGKGLRGDFEGIPGDEDAMNDGKDEADEDIHAREELLEVELQAATSRCEELRHTLQETKSMIPTGALVGVDGGGDGVVGIRSGGEGFAHVERAAGVPPRLPACSRLAAVEDDGSENDDVDYAVGEGEEAGSADDEGDDEKDTSEGSSNPKAEESGSSRRSFLRNDVRNNLRSSDRRGSFRNDSRRGVPGDVLRAWEEGNVGPAIEIAGVRDHQQWRGRALGGGGGGGRTSQVGGGSDSSEESRQNYYSYGRSQLESEAKAVYGHDTDGSGAQPKRRQPRSRVQASSSSSFSSSSPSSAQMAIRGEAPGKDGRSSGRESKRPSRRPAAHTTADGVGGEVGVRGGGVDGVWTPAGPRLRIDGGTSLAGGGAGVAGSVEPPVVECLPSPPPSAPTGRLADRIRTLRERCRLGLGADTFERAYRYLKARAEPGMSGGESDGHLEYDREERLVRELTDILGQSKIHYYSLIDQLIFIENTHLGFG